MVVSLQQVADALRLLLERARVVAEGAGASSLAAAQTGKVPGKRIVAVISGGNIDLQKVARIIAGEVP
ncbi:L-threonine dehydratase catabolic TdcB [compost metagenome]